MNNLLEQFWSICISIFSNFTYDKLKIIFSNEKNNNITPGGDGGFIYIHAQKIEGGGKITANGGDGHTGGKGGKIQIISEENFMQGSEISANGGKSLGKK